MTSSGFCVDVSLKILMGGMKYPWMASDSGLIHLWAIALLMVSLIEVLCTCGPVWLSRFWKMAGNFCTSWRRSLIIFLWWFSVTGLVACVHVNGGWKFEVVGEIFRPHHLLAYGFSYAFFFSWTFLKKAKKGWWTLSLEWKNLFGLFFFFFGFFKKK